MTPLTALTAPTALDSMATNRPLSAAVGASTNGTAARRPGLYLLRVEPTGDLGWRLMPQALRRIATFCTRYPTELQAADLIQAAKIGFITGDPHWGLWVAVDAQETVHGHLVAHLESARRVVFVDQLEVDGGMTPSLARAGLRALDTWARAVGARAIDAATWHAPRKWSRVGFVLHRSLIRRSLADG